MEVTGARRYLEEPLQVEALARQRRGREQVVGPQRAQTGSIVDVAAAAQVRETGIDLKAHVAAVELLLTQGLSPGRQVG